MPVVVTSLAIKIVVPVASNESRGVELPTAASKVNVPAAFAITAAPPSTVLVNTMFAAAVWMVELTPVSNTGAGKLRAGAPLVLMSEPTMIKPAVMRMESHGVRSPIAPTKVIVPPPAFAVRTPIPSAELLKVMLPPVKVMSFRADMLPTASSKTILPAPASTVMLSVPGLSSRVLKNLTCPPAEVRTILPVNTVAPWKLIASAVVVISAAVRTLPEPD